MRYIFLLLLVGVTAGCNEKSDPERTNFFELTLDGRKLSFNIKDTALLDTVPNQSFWELDVTDNNNPQSNLRWVLYSTSKWVNGTYEFPGLFNDRRIFYVNLTTYANGQYEGYSLDNGYLNGFNIIIDRSENWRLHGTLSGKITCTSCTPSGKIVPISNGEFEMPFRFK